MSGIAVSYGTSDKTELKQMLSKLKHRGETSDIIATRNKNIILGYRSNKLDSVNHPGTENTFYTDGKINVVCDAQLYEGRQFKHDNSSFIARSFLRQGRDCLKNLDGSYALAVTDGKSLLVARDLYGIKPLYYGWHKHNKDVIYFASEIKGLAEVSVDIQTFPPGHYYMSQQGFQPLNSQNPRTVIIPDDPHQAAKQVKQLLIEAVAKHYVPEEHPGILLSGGLDSSILASSARENNEKVNTFAVGMVGSPDLEAASLVARHLGAVHHEYTYTKKEIMQVLPEVIYYLESFDAPLVQSAIANYYASKLAAEAGCRSVLCGEGADELFGGYHYVKLMTTPESINEELQKILSTGHAMGLQRVDRMNNAHSLEARIPFMCKEIIDFAAATPLNWKIYGQGQIEKWILRRAFESSLPEKIVWRRKAQFSHGSNCNTIMEEISNDLITDEEFKKAKEQHSHVLLRTKEEYFYYSIFCECFPHDKATKLVVQWSELGGDIV